MDHQTEMEMEELVVLASEAKSKVGEALAILNGHGHKDEKISQAIKEMNAANNTLLGMISDHLEKLNLG